MVLDTLIFVSKRLQPIVAALVCLASVQLAAASCTPEPAAMTWRAAIVR